MIKEDEITVTYTVTEIRSIVVQAEKEVVTERAMYRALCNLISLEIIEIKKEKRIA